MCELIEGCLVSSDADINNGERDACAVEAL